MSRPQPAVACHAIILLVALGYALGLRIPIMPNGEKRIWSLSYYDGQGKSVYITPYEIDRVIVVHAANLIKSRPGIAMADGTQRCYLPSNTIRAPPDYFPDG